jgi:hypothetical protein
LRAATGDACTRLTHSSSLCSVVVTVSTTSTAIAPASAARRSSYAARRHRCEHHLAGLPVALIGIGLLHRGHTPEIPARCPADPRSAGVRDPLSPSPPAPLSTLIPLTTFVRTEPLTACARGVFPSPREDQGPATRRHSGLARVGATRRARRRCAAGKSVTWIRQHGARCEQATGNGLGRPRAGRDVGVGPSACRDRPLSPGPVREAASPGKWQHLWLWCALSGALPGSGSGRLRCGSGTAQNRQVPLRGDWRGPLLGRQRLVVVTPGAAGPVHPGDYSPPRPAPEIRPLTSSDKARAMGSSEGGGGHDADDVGTRHPHQFANRDA